MISMLILSSSTLFYRISFGLPELVYVFSVCILVSLKYCEYINFNHFYSGVRRLVVVEAGSKRVEGIISLSDVFRFLLLLE